MSGFGYICVSKGSSLVFTANINLPAFALRISLTNPETIPLTTPIGAQILSSKKNDLPTVHKLLSSKSIKLKINPKHAPLKKQFTIKATI